MTMPHLLLEKRCSTCGASKPLSQYRPRLKSAPQRLKADCKACEGARKRVWVRENREHVATQKLAWKRANPEKNREYFRRWVARYGRRSPDFSAGQGVPETS